MTRLASFVFVLASIGCNHEFSPIGERCVTSSDCAETDNPCDIVDCIDQHCASQPLTPAPPSCSSQSDAPGLGEFLLDENDDGSVSLSGQLEDTEGFIEYIAAERARFAGVAPNTCVKRGFLVLPPSPATPLSGGDLRLFVDGMVVADIPHASGYRFVFAHPDIPNSQSFNYELAGEGRVSAAEGELEFPDVPVVLGEVLEDNTMVLHQTISFEPTAAQRVRVVFNVFTGSTLDTYDCIGDGAAGSLRISDELYALLEPNGSFGVNFENTTSDPIDMEDGERSTLWTARASFSVTWSSKD